MNVISMNVSNHSDKLSIESYKKIHRARSVFFLMEVATMKSDEENHLLKSLASHVFGYVSEDVCFVINEIESMGLCKDFENKKEEVDRGE